MRRTQNGGALPSFKPWASKEGMTSERWKSGVVRSLRKLLGNSLPGLLLHVSGRVLAPALVNGHVLSVTNSCLSPMHELLERPRDFRNFALQRRVRRFYFQFLP